MKPETYAKKYGLTSSEWKKAISEMNTPKKVFLSNGRFSCPVCGHTVRQFKKCSYCGQKLQEN